ncbi:MAG: glycosyltransferase [Ignavibacteriales bacterium]|nr:glycosyltransferase [Ignavibacteriales bacterium]
MPSRRTHNRSLDLSVIIVNYNVQEFLQNALMSLQKASRGLRAEFFVVDNASSDGSVEMIRKKFPGVQLIVSRQNEGFAKANNIALRRARGEYVLLVNPDTVVQEDTLRAMKDFFQTHRDAGMVGCRILNPDGTFQLACRRGFPTPWVAFTKIMGLSAMFPASKFFGRYNLTFKSPDETYEVDAISGSCMMLRRKVYEEVGGLDEDFFMYGEDLDWCYRIQRAGWKIFYLHATSIIHYKGESTRRSSIDEVKMFYEAMRLFVEKHLGASRTFLWLLKLSIGVTSLGAVLAAQLKLHRIALIDFLLVNATLLVAEFIRRNAIFQYPPYALPIVYVVPAMTVVLALSLAGVYTYRRMSVSRSIVGVSVAYLIISTLTAFFKDYAFSRIIVAISGLLSIVIVPGWRFVWRLTGRSEASHRISLLGRRAVVVGTSKEAIELARRLRQRTGRGYEVVGFVDTTRKLVGEVRESLPVLGTPDMIPRFARQLKISDVIFSPNALSYTDMLQVISQSTGHPVSFYLVPDTLDVMIGKTTIDTLDDLPLIELTYNIQKGSHRLAKRLFDVAASLLILITAYPLLYFFRAATGRSSGWIEFCPRVFAGHMSFVGPPERPARQSPPWRARLGEPKARRAEDEMGRRRDGKRGERAGPPASNDGQSSLEMFAKLMKPGVMGLVQLQTDRNLSAGEIEQYNLYYARNQSLMLDLEIILKTLVRRRNRLKPTV